MTKIDSYYVMNKQYENVDGSVWNSDVKEIFVAKINFLG